VEIGELEEPAGGLLAISQLGEGDTAWFVVRQ
jgi:hypothetical protein